MTASATVTNLDDDENDNDNDNIINTSVIKNNNNCSSSSHYMRQPAHKARTRATTSTNSLFNIPILAATLTTALAMQNVFLKNLTAAAVAAGVAVAAAAGVESTANPTNTAIASGTPMDPSNFVTHDSNISININHNISSINFNNSSSKSSNNNSNHDSNNSLSTSTPSLSRSPFEFVTTTIATSKESSNSFAYEATDISAIHRSLFITPATATATATVSVAATATSTINATLTHFYDLILSWKGICLIAVFCVFIIVTIIGNTLVILAVITTRRLKTVTNCFVMSLAVADLLVGIFVMPPAVAVHLIGSWQLGWILCDIWISLDVLLCTASILSLCAISIDRYLAVTRPLSYSRKRRSKRLALVMILIVWLLALAITCPPMLGWYEPGRRDLKECRYNQNEGYVIFSAMGSFFIPMMVMIYVYARISCVVASRHDNMTDISVHNKKFKRYTAADVDNDIEHYQSEQELSISQKKQLAARTFSNQTITKELHEIMLAEADNIGMMPATANTPPTPTTTTATTQCHGKNNKNGCYQLTRPSSGKRIPIVVTTMPTSTTATTNSSCLRYHSSQAHTLYPQQEQQSYTRTHSFRQHHLSAPAATNAGSLLSSPSLEQQDTKHLGRVHQHQHPHHHHHHHQQHAANSRSFSNRITSLKKENKTTQTLSIVVGGFIACWLPFFIYYLITPFLPKYQQYENLAKGLTWLGWFNSAINPFIYAFYSVDFRAAFWRLTCKRFFNVTPTKQQFQANTMSIRR